MLIACVKWRAGRVQWREDHRCGRRYGDCAVNFVLHRVVFGACRGRKAMTFVKSGSETKYHLEMIQYQDE